VEIATIVKPDTILAWHRTLADQQVDTSAPRTSVGRPRIDKEIEALVVRMARENRSWGYDRIVGALANLGDTISDQTVGNILKRHGIPPAPTHPQEDDHLERIYPCSHGHAGGDRFLHDRGVELVQDGAVRYVLGSLRRSVDDTGRTHDGLTHGAMDTPDLSVVVRLACAPSTHDRRGPGARMVRVHAV
jgi:hypothetical protein